jgi:DNA-binding response OmpR family regulator
MKLIEREKILLVDDQESFLLYLKTVLGQNGYEVITATDIETAYGLWLEKKPDLIITDLIMPDGNGDLLIKKIRRENESYPIILMSGFPFTSHQLQTVLALNVTIWEKSADYADFLKNVARLLDRDSA